MALGVPPVITRAHLDWLRLGGGVEEVLGAGGFEGAAGNRGSENSACMGSVAPMGSAAPGERGDVVIMPLSVSPDITHAHLDWLRLGGGVDGV